MFIRRLGALKHYDAQFFEAAHRLTKLLYKATNMRPGSHLAALVERLRLHKLASKLDGVNLNAGK